MARRTTQEIAAELRAAQERANRAAQRVAKLKRRLDGDERRRDMQRKCALGGALLAMAERGTPDDAEVVERVRRYLAAGGRSNAHGSNLAALDGTPFGVGGVQ